MLGTCRVSQSTRRENGELLASTSSPWPAAYENLSGTVSPASTVRSVPYAWLAGDEKPRRQSGCVSNASVPSLRPFVPPSLAEKPSPRREKDAQSVQASSPSWRASSAARIASRPVTNVGPQPWIFSPSFTSWYERLFPPVSHGS